MKTVHTLKGIAATQEVFLDGKPLDLKRSLKHRNHSPDGFAWGYTGSGPAQLALAIMLELTNKSDNYQQFKIDVISRIHGARDFDIRFSLADGIIFDEPATVGSAKHDKEHDGAYMDDDREG